MISVRNISKNFKNKQVLDNLSCEIEKGQVVCVIGPSGSGKSTFLRCLNRMETIDAGQIFYRDWEVSSNACPIETVRKHMVMVFQHFNLFPHLKVCDNITLAPLQHQLITKAAARDYALGFLEQVGLKELADVYPITLSGGQKQRVAIARALAMQPETILFDEPTSALDPEMVGEVLNVMRDLAKKGLTMIVVTHQMEFAKQVADRILFIADGKIQADGNPKAIFENPSHPRLCDFLRKVNQL